MSWGQERFEEHEGSPPFVGNARIDLDGVENVVGYGVYSLDLRRLGTVEQVLRPQSTARATSGGYYLLVKPGMIQSLLGVEQVHIPSAHVASVDAAAGNVYLDVPGDLLEVR